MKPDSYNLRGGDFALGTAIGRIDMRSHPHSLIWSRQVRPPSDISVASLSRSRLQLPFPLIDDTEVVVNFREWRVFQRNRNKLSKITLVQIGLFKTNRN